MNLAATLLIDPIRQTAGESQCAQIHAAAEAAARDARHPLSRWYLLPLAEGAARALTATRVRPWHVTLLGFSLAAIGAVLLIIGWPSWLAAVCVLAAWLCDRIDGKLARRQGTASPAGAWLDANLDELADIGLHAAVAAAAAQIVAGPLPWLLFAAFVSGKYLFLHSRQTEQASSLSTQAQLEARQEARRTARWAVNLPGNADVRLHLLVAALASGWLLAELILVAAYYNLRWLARYVAVALGQVRPGGAA